MNPYPPVAPVGPQAVAPQAVGAVAAPGAPAAVEMPEGVRVPVPPGVVENVLASLPLFQGCDRTLLQYVAPQVVGLETPTGGRLLRGGAVPGGLGVLVGGTARLLLPGSETTLETLRAPDLFGEAGVLTGAAQPYTVLAGDECRLFWMTAPAAALLFQRFPGFGAALARRLADRLSLACAAAARAPAPEVRSAEPEEQGSIKFVELSDFNIQPSVLAMVPAKLVRQHRLLPVQLQGRKLTVAMVAPRNMSALGELKRVLQSVEIEVVAIAADDFAQSLTRLRLDDGARGPVKPGAKGPSIDPNSIAYDNAEAEREREREAQASAKVAVGDDVIKIVNRIIAAGIDRESSDIHIEPMQGGMRVRFRTSGTLQEWEEQIRPELVKGIIARFKVLGGLDITERRKPQDGRISLTIGGKREVDLRMNALPSSRGEKIVLRILEGAGSTRPLGQVFSDPTLLTRVRKTLNRPYGGIIVAGATGAGKTSTLYAMLNERRTSRPDTNIIMVEDPVEYRLHGVTQVQVDQGAGMTFALALRAMLRQDPDVIVVGETRDSATAHIALEAAMTGHLLLTSLHANTAIACLQRLESLECGRPLLSQSLALIIVQRLVRKLCSACKRMDEPPRALLEALVARKVADASMTALPFPVGCDACKQTGFAGRVAVMEALFVTDEVRNALAAGRALTDIEQAAIESKALMPYHQAARHLLNQGLVSGSEALLTVAD